MRKGINGLRMNYARDRKIFLLVFVLVCIASFFYAFSDISFPFVFGFVLAYLFAPVVNFSSKYVNRSLISFSFVILFVAVFVSAGLIFIPKTKEYILYVVENIPKYYDDFVKFSDQFISSQTAAPYQAEIESLKQELQKYTNQKLLILTSVLKGIASRKSTIAEWMSFFIIAPISFYYFSRDWKKLSAKVYDLVPPRHHEFLTEIFLIIRESFRRFFHAQFSVVLMLFAYYAICLQVIGIDHSLFFGLFSGLLSFIPFIGAMIACFIVIFLSISSLTVTKLWILLAIYALGQIIEGYILSPKFVGKGTGLHPLWILFAFFAGFKLLNILGVLISIPVIAMLRDLINFGVYKFKASPMYKQ